MKFKSPTGQADIPWETATIAETAPVSHQLLLICWKRNISIPIHTVMMCIINVELIFQRKSLNFSQIQNAHLDFLMIGSSALPGAFIPKITQSVLPVKIKVLFIMYAIKTHCFPLKHAEKVGSQHMLVTMGSFHLCSFVVKLWDDVWDMIDAESPQVE